VNQWFETIAVVFVILLGVFLGRTAYRLKKHYWIAAYTISLLLIVLLVLTRFNRAFAFMPPFSLITAGRLKFVLLALSVTLGVSAVIGRLQRRFERCAIYFLMAVVAFWFCVLPFLAPALIKDNLSSIETRVDSDGVCFQSRSFTCGPAAAVTALRKLGLPAGEGEIAILARSSPIMGTLPYCLYTAIQNRYSTDGLNCQYKSFDSIEQLTDAGITLAVVKDAFLLDHCVAVLKVTDRYVSIADPVLGRVSLTHQEFEKIWRFTGIVLTRNHVKNI